MMKSSLQFLLICLILSGGFFPSPSSHGVGRALAQQDKEDKEDVPEDEVEAPPPSTPAPTVPQDDVQEDQNETIPPSTLAPSVAQQDVPEDEVETPSPSTPAPTVPQDYVQEDQNETPPPSTLAPSDAQDDVEEVEVETPPLTTLAPTVPLPTPPPVSPTDAPSTTAPTDLPSLAPQQPAPSSTLTEAPLPEIILDLTITGGNVNAMATIETTTNCYSFLQDFIEKTLTSSRVMSASSLNSTSLDINLVSETEADTDGATTTNKSVEGSDSTVRIVIDGTVVYYPLMITNTDADEQTDWQDSVSHGLSVYLTLWGTSDLEQLLEQACGFVNARVTAVRVDGKLVEIPDYDDDNNGTSNSLSQQPATEMAAATTMLSSSTKLFPAILFIGRLLLWLVI